jgi:competence protein ComEA
MNERRRIERSMSRGAGREGAMSKRAARAWVGVLALSVGFAGSAMAQKRTFDRTPRPVTGVVNINTAALKELAMLPGVGRHAAQLIVAYREKQPFKSPAEIVNVKGVGQGIYRRIKAHLAISGPTTLAVQPKSPHLGPERTDSPDNAEQASPPAIVPEP